MPHSPTELARELGRLVHERRTELGLSQAELADRCGMKQPQVSRFEAGGTVPTLPLLRRLADALGADLTISLTPHDEAA
ncbi:helix-turn-helix domain-containing protein [Streptomyces sp. NBC_00209]|uniref:helix-turn-helix domain-containing protein n=1 Tax=Streptomyces sp. NBC_00209 TaxID=2975682 RepID=UPI00386AE8B0